MGEKLSSPRKHFPSSISRPKKNGNREVQKDGNRWEMFSRFDNCSPRRNFFFSKVSQILDLAYVQVSLSQSRCRNQCLKLPQESYFHTYRFRLSGMAKLIYYVFRYMAIILPNGQKNGGQAHDQRPQEPLNIHFQETGFGKTNF